MDRSLEGLSSWSLQKDYSFNQYTSPHTYVGEIYQRNMIELRNTTLKLIKNGVQSLRKETKIDLVKGINNLPIYRSTSQSTEGSSQSIEGTSQCTVGTTSKQIGEATTPQENIQELLLHFVAVVKYFLLNDYLFVDEGPRTIARRKPYLPRPQKPTMVFGLGASIGSSNWGFDGGLSEFLDCGGQKHVKEETCRVLHDDEERALSSIHCFD
ncbi:Uncharacterized protein Fot_24619 [Forsythia ovata]|uniref:Uncharacterized protein n=1 Tax=Forsythia ovata TaxID=205694 RepID=A0ABD1U6Q3_9LAMI